MRTKNCPIKRFIVCLFGALALSSVAAAAPPNRVTTTVNRAQTRAIKNNIPGQAQTRYDQGLAAPTLNLDHILLLFQTSATQQQDLESLLKAQQNPSSPDYHNWLTPEQFGDRFGISAADHAKVIQWLQDEGLTINESARGRNWVAFSGTTAQVTRTLRTSIHSYNVNGESHFANAEDPQVPAALAPIVKGFIGLDDFVPKPNAARLIPIGTDPSYNRGASHYLVPEDFSTIYNLNPLYQAGFDGTGQSIAIVGQSAVLLSDIRAFRARYNLPPNDPKLIPYAADPGFNGAQLEGNLDLEWAGAIAPKATIFYFYGPNVLTATIAAINLNAAPVISISYGGCEIDFSVLFYQAAAQQANAQGITILASSGDSGAASCDRQGGATFATRGRAVSFPAVLPEVTAVGGTQFNEGTANYWADTNTINFGSALSYIPEIAWNESSPRFGLLATGGGASIRFSKPDWQTGPGVPLDQARDIPDISLSAAVHDAYYITYLGSLGGVAGTSASSPSLAGILALLNQYQVANAFQKQPGLGNINPQLYRLAQVAPSAFHDIISGDNKVPCAQGTPDCLADTIGYSAGPGYDLATGLGSIDADQFFAQWNTATAAVSVTFTINPAKVTVNDTADFLAVVTPVSSSGTPTGTVTFSAGTIPLGSAVLTNTDGRQTAKLTLPAWRLGAGNGTINAVYAGDATFSGAGASAKLQIINPAGVSAVLLTISPNPVYAAPADAQGFSWQTTVTLREVSGVPSNLTGFTIDGVVQPLAANFPSPSIPASGTLTASIVLRNIAYPATKIFAFTGIDSTGATWTRQLSVNFQGPQVFQNFLLSATPLTMQRNAAADPSCAWSQRLSLDETGGYAFQLTGLFAGSINISTRIPAIFGTTRLAAYGSLQGTLCWGGATPPATNEVFVTLVDESGNSFNQDLIVAFDAAAPTPTKLTAAPPTLAIQQTAATLSVDPGDKAQTWTASVFPANRTTAWLTLSRYSGSGPAQVTVQASGTGFRPGVYRASIVLQSAGAVPQYITVPVMYTFGASGGSAIAAAGNAFSFKTVASPGMVMTVYGTQLSNSVQQATSLPLPYALDGVSATINGIAAPLFFTSAGQLNIQVPFDAGAGPAVLGINNHGQIAGYQFQITPTAPAIVADVAGNITPAVSVNPGGIGVLYLTGAGDLNGTRPRLPLSVTAGGIQAFIQFAGATPNTAGLIQINFVVPASVAPGVQPVVVTVNGVSSPAANITVQAP